MRARPEIARPGARAAGSMVGQMLGVLKRRWARTVIIVVALEGGVFWGCFTFVGADLHQRFGLGFAAVGLAVAAFGAGGFLYVTVAPHPGAPAGRARPGAVGRHGPGRSPSRCWRWRPMRSWPSPRSCCCGITFYMLHNTLQTHGTQMAPEARGSALALFALCLFVGQAIGVPLAAPIVDRWGAVPIFWFAAAVPAGARPLFRCFPSQPPSVTFFTLVSLTNSRWDVSISAHERSASPTSPSKQCDVLVVDDDFALSEADQPVADPQRPARAQGAQRLGGVELRRLRAAARRDPRLPAARHRPASRWPPSCAPRSQRCTSS